VVTEAEDGGAAGAADTSPGGTSAGGTSTRSARGADSRTDQALTAAPVVVGAAEDGVTLSPAAAAALRACLPDIPFDATAPLAGAPLTTPEAAPAEAAEPTGAGPPAAAAGPPENEVRDLREEATPSPADGTAESPAGATAGPVRGIDPDTVPVPAGTSGTLPGILAAAVVAALVLLLYLVLG